MSLCIVDSEPLDVMESLVADLDFGAIENKNVERKEWESPYGEEQLRKRIEIVPVEDVRKLTMCLSDSRPTG
ncbi:hypothetical protein COOONC_01661 [Cooperia oncophora]